MRAALITLLCIPAFVFAEGNLMFQKANELYHNKNYDSAVVLYTKLIENNFCSAELFYNAGNAYYQSNKIGMAIWAFKKSLKLSEEKNTRDNYLIAKKRIAQPLIENEPIFFIRWWRALYKFFSVNTWSVLALLSFLIWLGMLYLERVGKLGFPNGIKRIVLVVSLFCLCFTFVRFYNDTYHFDAVVLRQTYYSSKEQGEAKQMLAEGIEVRILNKKQLANGLYYHVNLPDGREAWLASRDIKKI
jgi:tetratricopeptide (TPR) repeat protein